MNATKTRNPRFNALTGLKGICCLMIMVLHSFKPEGIPTITTFIQDYFPDFGNYVFFMISGFLMASFYKDRILERKITFHDFFLNKFIKFYPLYALTNIIAMLLDIAENGTVHFSVSRIALILVMGNGGTLDEYEMYNYPTWFICVLVVCFVVFFFIAYISNGNTTKYLAGAVIMISIGYWVRGFGIRAPFLYGLTANGYVNFFIGVILAEVYRRIGNNKKVAACTFGTIILLMVLMLTDKRGFGAFWGQWTMALPFCIAPLLIYVCMAVPVVNKFMSNPVLMFIGNLSISIYFWHAITSYLYSFTIRDSVAQSFGYAAYYCIYLITTFVVCLLSKYFIEQKFTAWLSSKITLTSSKNN